MGGSARVSAGAADAVLQPAGPATLGTNGLGAAIGDLYLLAAERSTGQPPPPDGPVGPAELVRSERPGRVAIGLSGA
jgi:hypothetical protein